MLLIERKRNFKVGDILYFQTHKVKLVQLILEITEEHFVLWNILDYVKSYRERGPTTLNAYEIMGTFDISEYNLSQKDYLNEGRRKCWR